MASPTAKQNQLLAALKQQEFMRLEHELEPVEFLAGQWIYRSGEVIDYLYFPVNLAVSVSVSGGDGESTSLAIVGNEGVLGFSVTGGSERMPYDIVAINHGVAYRLRRELADWEFDQHGSLLWLVLRYGQIAAFSFAQTAICNQYHSVEQRLCGWFLGIAGKSGQTHFSLTHAFIAGQLGVRREAISEAAAALQSAGVIEYSRGKITLLDMEALRHRACTCGESIRKHQQQLPPKPADTLWRYRVRPDSVSIRRLAEERARHSSIPKPSSLSDYGRLVAELEVRKHTHDIQMEELIESHAEADRLRERYADIYDFSPVAYASVDALGVLKQINLSAAILLGVKRSETARHRFVDSIVADQRGAFTEFLKQVLNNHGHHRIETTLAETGQRPEAFVIIDGIADESRTECRMVITDVTKEKAYEKSLRRAYELLDMSQAAANAGSWDWDIVSGQITWSENLFTLFGLDASRDRPSFDVWRKVLHPDDCANAEEEIQRAIRDHCKLFNQYRICQPDGEIRWINSVGETFYDEAGKPLHMLGICIDATRQLEAEAEIRRYAEKLRTLADFTYDWEYWQSPKGTLHYVSPSCERISGYHRDQFLADPGLLTKIVFPEDRATFVAHMEETSVLSPSHEMEFRIVRKDGETRWISHCCQPVHSETGKYLGRRVSNRDVTEKKAAEAQLRLWSESFMHSDLGLAISDAKRNVFLAVNPAFARDRGYTPDELAGSPVSSIVPEQDWSEFIQRISQIKSSHVVLESRHRCKDGRIFPVLLDMTLLYDAEGNPANRVVYASDISERKQHETQLKRYQDKLEALVTERTRDLENAKLQAEAANHAKTAFLANISHELRTPLHAIIGMAQLLAKTPLDPLQQERLQNLRASSSHLLGLITKALNSTNIDSKTLNQGPCAFSPARLLEQVKERFTERVTDRGVTLSANVDEDVPDTVLGRDQVIAQILYMLTDNAFKFTKSSQVKLSVSRIGDSGESTNLRFAVVDSGIGLNEETRKRLFECFRQGDESLSRSCGGLGLGLTVARNLVEALGGIIGVESIEGKGCTFWFNVSLASIRNLPET